MSEPARAVVLVSGGLDSATTLAVAKRDGVDAYALSFRYGQRHMAEIDAATRVARSLGATRHVVMDIDLRAIGGSALTADFPVPVDRTDAEMGQGVPITYVPARNTIFLSYALGWAEVLDATAIYLGVNAIDYSGYPDCRPEFIEAFEALANRATRATVETGRRLEIRTPLISLTKAQIITLGMSLGVDLGLTRSCYTLDALGRSCGRCDSCRLRRKGFEAAGLTDPIPYRD